MSAIRKYDSVDCILDKIDAELLLLKPLELPAFLRTPEKGGDSSSAARSCSGASSSAGSAAAQSHGGGDERPRSPRDESSAVGGGSKGGAGSNASSSGGVSRGSHHGCKENATDTTTGKATRTLERLPDSASQSEFSLTEPMSSEEDDDIESVAGISDIRNEPSLLASTLATTDCLNSTRTEDGYDTELELKAELTKESSRIQKEIQQERAAREATAKADAAAAAAAAAAATTSAQAAAAAARRRLPRSTNASPVRPGCSSRITEELEEDDDEEDELIGVADEDYANGDDEDEAIYNIDVAKSVLEETLCSIKEAKQEKLMLLLEVNGLQDNVEELENTLHEMEKLTLDNRARAEEARSQLTLVECQKANLMKDLEKLNAEIELKQDVLSKGAHKKRMFGNAEHGSGESSGSSEQQSHLLELLEEKNQLIAVLEQQCRSVQRERDELEKCVALVNDELINERKKSRMRVDTAEEEVESLLHKMDESNTALEELSSRLRASEAKVQQLQEEKIQCILEKTRECEELKGQSQRDLLEVKAYTATELAGMAARQKLDEEKIAKLYDELAWRDQTIADARNQISALQQAVAEKDKEKDAAAKEWALKLDEAARSKANDIKTMKETAERDLQQLKRSLQSQMSAETEALLQNVKREHVDQILHLQRSAAGKEEEISLLKESLKTQEEAMQRTIANIQADAKLKRDELIRRERELWEQERHYLGQQQMAHYKEELCKHMEKLKEQYESEHALVQQLQHKNRALAAELDDVRQNNVRMSQDYQRKLTSASKSKKAIQKELTRELESAKIEWEEEKLTEMKRLADALDEKDATIQTLETTQKSLAQRETELENLLDKYEHTVVQEINDECRKTALVLGVAPRKAAITTSSRASGGSPSTRRSLARSAITSALANLRACNDELRSHVKEVAAAGDSARTQLNELQQKQSTEIEKLKTRLQREKLKEQMAKEEAKQENGVYTNGVDAAVRHRGRNDWDDLLYDPDVPELAIPERTVPDHYCAPLTKQLQMQTRRQENLNDSRSLSFRRLPPKRLAAPSKVSRTASVGGFDEPLTTVAMLRKLQERVKHVCTSSTAPNGSADGSCNGSISDLSSLSEAVNGFGSSGMHHQDSAAADCCSRSLENRAMAAESQGQLPGSAKGGTGRYDQLLGQKLQRKDAGDQDRSQSRSTRMSALSLSNLQ